MSPTRRTANETHILAVLDRHESGGRMRRLLRGLGGLPVMVWYGSAGLVVAGLVGSLAWLALDNGAPPAGETALAGTAAARRPAAEAPVAASAALPAPVAASAGLTASVSAKGSAETADDAHAAGATIVDLAPAEAAEPAAPLTELRVLPPQQHAGRIAQRESPRESRREGRRELPAERQRPSAHAATPRTAPRSAAAAAGKAPSAARAAGLAHAEPRSRRAAAQAKAAPSSVDTDVALISAIIQHANKRQEAEEAAAKQ